LARSGRSLCALDPHSGPLCLRQLARAPNPFPGKESEIEIRQVFEAEDFGDALTPELREQEERMSAQSGYQAPTQH